MGGSGVVTVQYSSYSGCILANLSKYARQTSLNLRNARHNLPPGDA